MTPTHELVAQGMHALATRDVERAAACKRELTRHDPRTVQAETKLWLRNNRDRFPSFVLWYADQVSRDRDTRPVYYHETDRNWAFLMSRLT